MFRLIELKLAKAKGSRKIRKIVKFLRKIFGEKDPGNIGFNFSEYAIKIGNSPKYN